MSSAHWILATCSLLSIVQMTRAVSPSCRCVSPEPCFDQVPWIQLSSEVQLEKVSLPHLCGGNVHCPAQKDPLWLTAQPGGTFHTGTNGAPTIPGWATTNSTAANAVYVRDAEDASVALEFAAENNLAISVKATGHDWFGRSSGQGTLLLWSHHMDTITWHDDFIPTGALQSVGVVVTVGAGVQFWQLLDEAKSHQRLVVTGTCTTVGHVGFTLGGGYGDYSRMYGSGATNLVEAEVVLANGTIVNTSTSSHSDLFRALRGGGGAFGFVTKMSYRTYPYPEHVGSVTINLHGSLSDGVRRFSVWYRDIVQQGVAQHFGGQVQVGGFVGDNVVSIQLKYSGIPQDECSHLIHTLDGDSNCQADSNIWPPPGSGTSPVDGIPGWVANWEDNSASSYHKMSMSRYFRLEDLQDGKVQSFADTVSRLAAMDPDAGAILGLNYALGYGSETALAFVNETLVHPQVSVALGIIKLDLQQDHFVPTTDTPMDVQAWDLVEASRRELDSLIPASGSYYNEGDYTEVDWQERYWGDNYPELLRTKHKYDPEHVFSCHQCVGSEEQDACGRKLRSDTQFEADDAYLVLI